MKKIPHDQNDLLKITNPNYQKFVLDFFECELKNDGIDITSQILFAKQNPDVKAKIIAKEEGILAGKEEIEFCLQNLSLLLKGEGKGEVSQAWHKQDGEEINPNDLILKLKGNAKDLLKVERVIINIIARMSGIATKTKKIVDQLDINMAQLSGTRKVLWGLLDNKAVVVGGALTHRLNLEHGILIKENHLIATGGIKKALSKIQSTVTDEHYFWEIEVETEDEFLNVLENLPKTDIPAVIMFDNFKPEKIKEILSNTQHSTLNTQNLFFEASGGINENNYLEYAKTGVDVISCGFLTKNAHSIDMSMRIYN